jgi:hypothetical protein
MFIGDVIKRVNKDNLCAPGVGKKLANSTVPGVLFLPPMTYTVKKIFLFVIRKKR